MTKTTFTWKSILPIAALVAAVVIGGPLVADNSGASGCGGDPDEERSADAGAVAPTASEDILRISELNEIPYFAGPSSRTRRLEISACAPARIRY